MNYIISKETVTIVLDGVVYVFPVDSEKGKRVIKGIQDKISNEEMMNIITEEKLKAYCNVMQNEEGVLITDTNIRIDGEDIPVSLQEVIRQHYDLNLPIDSFVNFVRKLRKNPSYRIRHQLYDFIAESQKSGGFTLSDDGDIMAYKLVTHDFKDIYTNSINNTPGSIVTMDRSIVDDDPTNTCSVGLHFCAFSYLDVYRCSENARIVLLKVNPMDVVSIPVDYNNAKGRCCAYKVVQEVHHVIDKPIFHDEGDTINYIYTTMDFRDLFNSIFSSEQVSNFESIQSAFDAFASHGINKNTVLDMMKQR